MCNDRTFEGKVRGQSSSSHACLIENREAFSYVPWRDSIKAILAQGEEPDDHKIIQANGETLQNTN